MEINQQLEEHKRILSRKRRRMQILWPAIRTAYPMTTCKNHPQKNKLSDLRISPFDWRTVENLYYLISKRQRILPRFEMQNTYFENLLTKKILREAGLRCVFQSVWIGNHCVDLFFPRIAGAVGIWGHRTMGLVLEVDGGFHNSESKMKRDLHLIEDLSALNIPVSSIANQSINGAWITSLVTHLSGLSRLDTRATQRVWRRVHLDTVLSLATDDELNSCIVSPHLLEALTEVGA